MSLSMQEQIILLQKDLFGSNEDAFVLGSSGAFDRETLEEGARIVLSNFLYCFSQE